MKRRPIYQQGGVWLGGRLISEKWIEFVRRGLDHGKQGFNRWDLTREVLKAFTSE